MAGVCHWIRYKMEVFMEKNNDAAKRFSFFTPEKDREYLRRCFRIAEKSRRDGNTPFGALLVDQEGNILIEQGNIEILEKDCTGHAETTLARKASKKYDKSFLWNCSLYTSCEPCAMCTGAIYWGNIGRIVYAVPETMLLEKTSNLDTNPTFNIDCRTILGRGQKDIVVVGPYPDLLDEAFIAHDGYWPD